MNTTPKYHRDGRIELTAEKGYTLNIVPNDHDPQGGKKFHFDVNHNNHPFYKITARDLALYGTSMSQITSNPTPNLTYAEIGAGLGEFIPALIASGRLQHRPIVIDPADYALLNRMLEEGIQIVTDHAIQAQMEQAMQRCQLILDPTKVKLVNKTLDRALTENPELKESIDVIVDMFGPCYWTMNGPGGTSFLDQEARLLQEGGTIHIGRYNRTSEVYSKSNGKL